MEGLLSRIEYRHDWSDVDFFDRGQNAARSDHQDTIAIAFIAYFGPKR